MVKKDKATKEDDARYFILERDSLSMFGNAVGSDKAEAERLLSESDDVNDLVVIRGVIIRPYFSLE